jgi:hypothetical protein
MSRLARPSAASSATSRSRAVSGSMPLPRANGGVATPPARVAMTAARAPGRGGTPLVATAAQDVRLFGGGLGSESERVDGL